MKIANIHQGKGKKQISIFFLCLMYVFMWTGVVWSVTVDVGQGKRIFVPVKSFKDLRDEHMVKQAYDYSCGAAALATLLTYGLGDEASEKDVLSQVMSTLTKEDLALRRKEGLSLLDLKRVSLERGHKAQGFKLNPEFLSKLKRPVLVFIKPRGYEHFAVLKGIQDNYAYLADPSQGNVRIPLYKFLHMWLGEDGKGIIFVVEQADGAWPDNYSLKTSLRMRKDPGLLSIRQLIESSKFTPSMIQRLDIIR